MPVLPEDLEIPNAYIGEQMDLSIWRPAVISIRNKKVVLETVKGDFVNPRFGRIPNMLESRYTFVIADQGIFDSLLRRIPRHLIMGMDLGAAVEIEGWEVTYRGSGIRFKKGKTIYWIINLAKFFKLPKYPETLYQTDSLVLLLLDYLERHNLSYSSLTSPASISRGLMLLYAYSEFVTNQQEWQVIHDTYQACHGGRQESTGIGVNTAVSYDMKNAHLNILSSLPSIRRTDLREDWPYISESSWGVYQITANVPKMPVCPIPVEVKGTWTVETSYPYGNVPGWYAKPFIDLLIGHGIKFDIHKSYQYVPVGEVTYPFKSLTDRIRKLIHEAPSYIDAKAFYYGMAGSTISWRHSLNKHGEIVPRAYSVFNPLIYSHVLAAQTVRVFKETTKSSGLAIRSDAITVDRKIGTSLRLEEQGEHIFYTPLFKSFPSGKGRDWRDLAWERRDHRTFSFYSDTYPTVGSFLATNAPLGKLRSKIVSVAPNHGRRKGELPKRLGDLFDNWYPSEPFEYR